MSTHVALPKTHQSSIFFTLPRELCDYVYEFAFTNLPADGPSSQIASPLLTCRQWYAEAKAIAIATIDSRIDWNQIYCPYYDGVAFWDAGREAILRKPIRSTCNPLDCIVTTTCRRAGLTT
jgi:hypothetical protein